MEDVSVLQSNTTEVSSYSKTTIEAVRTSLLIILLLCFLFFLYFMKVLLSVYFTNAHIRDSSRYILFAHMLINDTIYLFLGLLFMVMVVYVIYIPLLICYIILSGTLTVFVVTPYNLAIMSLERYIAVCHPLRHTELCTVQKSYAAILGIWILGFLPNIVDMVIMSSFIKKNDFLSITVVCKNEVVTMTPLQDTIKSLNIILGLSLVGLIIACTYIRVIVVAHKAGGSSAFKAGKTLMLHAFQLLLCMTSLTSSFVQKNYNSNFFFLRVTFFILCICLPRFLSPLIYGLRDELLRKYIKKMYSKSQE